MHGIGALKADNMEKEQKKSVKNNGQDFPKRDEHYKPKDPRKKAQCTPQAQKHVHKAHQNTTAQNQ